MRLIFTIIFLIVGLVGFLGNLCTIAVIIRTPSLHSQTNYLLANLAFSDLLLICSGVPFDLFYLWRTADAPAFLGYCELTSVFFLNLQDVGLIFRYGHWFLYICFNFDHRGAKCRAFSRNLLPVLFKIQSTSTHGHLHHFWNMGVGLCSIAVDRAPGLLLVLKNNLFQIFSSNLLSEIFAELSGTCMITLALVIL